MAQRALLVTVLGWSCVVSVLVACSRGAPEPSGAGAPSPPPVAQAAVNPGGADAKGDAAPATLRRVVQQASLGLEVVSPPDAEAQVARIVQRAGGYVASAERSASEAEGERAASSVTVTLRVPSAAFSTVLVELRRLGEGSGSERITTEDVTEEFIDLEARLHNQERLEQQFLVILGQAKKVDEALGVQRELATVRTEIERLEGRRRFLEHETALATITLSLTEKRPFVSASFADLGHAARRAGSDAIEVSASVVTGSLRFVGVTLPLVLFFGLPAAGLIRAARARRRRRMGPVTETG